MFNSISYPICMWAYKLNISNRFFFFLIPYSSHDRDSKVSYTLCEELESDSDLRVCLIL